MRFILLIVLLFAPSYLPAQHRQSSETAQPPSDTICNHTLFCIVPGVPGIPVRDDRMQYKLSKRHTVESELPRTPLEFPKDLPIPDVRNKSK